MKPLSKPKILGLFKKLNSELERQKVTGEIYVVGGAVMCLALNARPSTRDVDAYFKPTSALRKAALKVAEEEDLPENWLNDAVKTYLSEEGTFTPYEELSNLKVFTARADYLLAMKALSLRIGEEFYDLEDLRYLIRHLNLESVDEVTKILKKYYPIERFPQKTFYALEELFSRPKKK